jgi:hypothetical protein
MGLVVCKKLDPLDLADTFCQYKKSTRFGMCFHGDLDSRSSSKPLDAGMDRF